jgi:hypothetical protein
VKHDPDEKLKQAERTPLKRDNISDIPTIFSSVGIYLREMELLQDGTDHCYATFNQQATTAVTAKRNFKK